jgi:hypothetical protein
MYTVLQSVQKIPEELQENCRTCASGSGRVGAVVDRKSKHTNQGSTAIPTRERSTPHEDEDARQGW